MSTTAAIIASLCENTLTYPLEYLKVRQQLSFKISNGAPFSIPNFTSVMYAGFTPFAVGNIVKTLLRFHVFSSATEFLNIASPNERPSAPTVVAAGLLAGLAETLVIVPFESIKTTMIECSSINKGAATGCLPPLGAQGTQLVMKGKHSIALVPSAPPVGAIKDVKKIRPTPIAPPQPQLHLISEPLPFFSTISCMYKQRGFRAFVQGFNPTVMRQLSNSMLRFTTWNAWSQAVAVEEKMSLYELMLGSMCVSLIETMATQPLDVVKSRMQTANGIKLYTYSLVCAYKTFADEGYKKLWAGSGPRFARKWLSGGIMWFVYENTFNKLKKYGFE